VRIEVTEEFIRSGSSAFGVDVAVHHDRNAAQAAGLRHIIMSTPHLSALMEAVVVSTFGGRVRDLRISMIRPVFAGTTVEIDVAQTHAGWAVTMTDVEQPDRALCAAACS